MERIRTRRTDLMAGTFVWRDTGWIVLTSDYQRDGYYYCRDVEIDDDGNECIGDIEWRVTPADLIGGEI